MRGHPRDRMGERRVTEEDVEHALHHYNYSESLKLNADPGKSRIVGPSVDGHRLHVVIMGELPPGQTVVVATAYWKREGGQR